MMERGDLICAVGNIPTLAPHFIVSEKDENAPLLIGLGPKLVIQKHTLFSKNKLIL